jgi:hypothetical protein
MAQDNNFEAVKANAVLEAWERRDRDHELWMAFANCVDGTVVAYPYGMASGMDQHDLLADVMEQHRKYSRPRIANVECLRVTPDTIATIESRFSNVPQDTEKGYCDFCSIKTTQAKKYAARDFLLQNGSLSIGGWMACANCSSYIDLNNPRGLSHWMVAVALDSAPHMNTKRGRARLREYMRRQVSDFFANRMHTKDVR